jgi:alkylation response protein AidB-like acyl-CoA dehydrogenase
MQQGLDDAVAVIGSRPSGDGQLLRRLAPEVVQALVSSGINRMLLPAELGGLESAPMDVVNAVARVGAADADAGWCVGISAGVAIFAGHLAPAAACEVFADPDQGAAGMFAPLGTVEHRDQRSGDGRTVLTGRWPFASNVLHSRWIGVGALVHDDGDDKPVRRVVFVPTEELQIEDSWKSYGLQNTGSHHVRADHVVVDLARSTTMAGSPWQDGPLWRLPLFTVLLPVLVAAPLGMARAAVDAALSRVTGSGSAAMRGELADDPVGVAELAAADASLRAAHAGVLSAVGDVWADAIRGVRASRGSQARCMMSVQHAIDVAVESVSTAHRLCGGAAAYAGHPLLTSLINIHTARQHISFAHQHRARLGRIAAGIDEVAPPFVL